MFGCGKILGVWRVFSKLSGEFGVNGSDVLILRGAEVLSLISGRELELMRIVETAYVLHAKGESSLPHSTFLHFPSNPKNRIIALPAYINLDAGVAGIKWISSFPGNIELGLERASAVLILNSTQTGRPESIIEGSIISAKRTAASAALATRHLWSGEESYSLGMIGCGLINFEISLFLLKVHRRIRTFVIFDNNIDHAHRFKEKCLASFENVEVKVVGHSDAVLESSPIISIATTAATPHISDLSACRAGSTLLHISLRDLTPQAILSGDNIVDDIDHVCRAQTSIHLAEQMVGDRSFIRGTLADVIGGAVTARSHDDRIAIFSPFGLGVLDIAVGRFVLDLAIKQGQGTLIESFLPSST